MAYGAEIAAIAAVVGAAAAVAGTAVATVSAVQQAKNNAAIAESQAEIVDLEAENQKAAAEYEERQFRRRAAVLMGKQSAVYAASGVDPSSGSPLLMTLDMVRQAEIEAQNIKRTGQVGAGASSFGASLQRYLAGRYRSDIPLIAAGGGISAIGQGTSALSSWMRPTGTSGTRVNPAYRTSFR